MPNKPSTSRKRRRGRPLGSTTGRIRGSAKQLCLQAAAKLFLERPAQLADPVARLTKSAVAREAGVHRNTLNRHLPAETWDEAIALYLLDRTDIFREEFEEVRQTVERTVALSSLDAVALTAQSDLGTLSDNPAWNAMEVLVTCVAPKSPEVAATARRCYRELDVATWKDIYGVVMKRFNREPRRPFTATTIGALLQALVEGAGIRHLFDEGTFLDRDRLDGSRTYGGYPLAVAALLAVLTKPAGTSDNRSVEAVIEDLMSS